MIEFYTVVRAAESPSFISLKIQTLSCLDFESELKVRLLPHTLQIIDLIQWFILKRKRDTDLEIMHEAGSATKSINEESQ